jgi:DNA-directed RNA polymerase subunit RPC12/RpoP
MKREAKTVYVCAACGAKLAHDDCYRHAVKDCPALKKARHDAP